MSGDSDIKYLRGLVDELRKLPRETPWVEFKHNNANPEDIGEYLSALSNAAALEGKANAYLVWGIEDVLGMKSLFDRYLMGTRQGAMPGGGKALLPMSYEIFSPKLYLMR